MLSEMQEPEAAPLEQAKLIEVAETEPLGGVLATDAGMDRDLQGSKMSKSPKSASQSISKEQSRET